MVKCREFKQWLIKQDAAGENVSQEVEDHGQVCKTCDALYQTDSVLEATIEKEMQSVDPPVGLIECVQRRIQAESRSRRFKFSRVSWKILVPALRYGNLIDIRRIPTGLDLVVKLSSIPR